MKCGRRFKTGFKEACVCACEWMDRVETRVDD